METNVNYSMVVLDSPNILFNSKQRGDAQIRRNVKAICSLLSKGLTIIFVITPKLLNDLPEETEHLADLITQKGGVLICSEGSDPDITILEAAILYNAPVISNDKFNKRKYDIYSSVRDRRIGFYISRRGKLVPKERRWKQFLDRNIEVVAH